MDFDSTMWFLKNRLPVDIFSEREFLQSLKNLSNEERFKLIDQTKDRLKNPQKALILSAVLSPIGCDRFYIGDIFLGLIKLAISILVCVCAAFVFMCEDREYVLISAVLCLFFTLFIMIWCAIDWYLIDKKLRKQNLNLLQTLLTQFLS